MNGENFFKNETSKTGRSTRRGANSHGVNDRRLSFRYACIIFIPPLPTPTPHPSIVLKWPVCKKRRVKRKGGKIAKRPKYTSSRHLLILSELVMYVPFVFCRVFHRQRARSASRVVVVKAPPPPLPPPPSAAVYSGNRRHGACRNIKVKNVAR